MTPDVAASVRAQLLAVARDAGEEFERTLVRFAAERWLYRLGQSSARDHCILKGAALLAVWLPNPHRATRDVDLLGTGGSDDSTIAALIAEVCATPCPEDGIVFDISALTLEPIRDDTEYAGVRAVFWARLASARIRMQVDIGFGDAVAYGPDDVSLPLILRTLPTTTLRAYAREQSIAEKFEAMIRLGTRNSRMKDFHDVWALAGTFAFDGSRLREAVAECFSRRGTPWDSETPPVLSAEFYATNVLRQRWMGYLNSGSIGAAPSADFSVIGERVIAFLLPVRDAVRRNAPLHARWTPAGFWEPVAEDE